MKTQEMLDRKERIVATNRKAHYDFIVLNSIETGIVLLGSEVKSIRGGKCNLQDSYAAFPNNDDDEILLYNMHVSPYEQASPTNHDPKRPRKLLVKAKEAAKLRTAVAEKGFTLIPLRIYFSGSFIKVELATVRAKKKYDKRETTKKRETEREIRRKFRH